MHMRMKRVKVGLKLRRAMPSSQGSFLFAQRYLADDVQGELLHVTENVFRFAFYKVLSHE